MPESAVMTTAPGAVVEPPERASCEPDPAAEDLVLADELLVEDVSIDGMCGVY